MQFYSVDTNTIYPPCLEIKWNDQVFNAGNLSPITTSNFYASLDNNPGIFYTDSVDWKISFSKIVLEDCCTSPI
jgi:hypothetical protein